MRRTLLLSASFLFASAQIAAAQQAAPAARNTTEDIIITAQKRSESVQDVPIAVTAITSEMRENAGLITTQQQLNFTPGVFYTEGTDRVTVRGVGRTTDQFGTDPGVAIYTDGFFLPSAVGVGSSTLRQARTEVLRGPQGTLYGRNSIGGAVNTVSRRPGTEFEAEVRARINDYEGRRFEARVAGPLTEHFRASFSTIIGSQDEGYFQNSCEGSSNANGCSTFEEGGIYDSIDGELQLSWDVGKRYEGWLRYYATESESHPRTAGYVSPYAVGRLDSTVNPTYGGINNSPSSPSYLDPNSNPGLRDPRIFTSDTRSNSRIENYDLLVSEQILHFDAFDIKYTGGYQHYDAPSYIDGDATSRSNFIYDGVSCLNPVLGGLALPVGVGFGYGLNSSAAIAGALQAGILGGTTFGGAVNFAGYLDSSYAGFFRGAGGANSFDCDFNTTNGVQFGEVNVANKLIFGSGTARNAHSHEINFASTGDGPFQWIFGLYYYEADDQTIDTAYSYLDQPEVRIRANAPGHLLPVGPPLQNPDLPGEAGNPLYIYDSALLTISQAIYGQIDIDFTPSLHGTFGLRYTQDRKKGFEDNRSQVFWYPFGIANDGTIPASVQDLDANGQFDPIIYLSSLNLTAQAYQAFVPQPDADGCTTLPQPCSLGFRTLTNKWNATTGVAGLQWTPNDDTLIYGRYSRGYKSGGFNLGTLIKRPLVDEETIDAFELGMKRDFGDAFRINGALFFYQYHDLQVAQAEQPVPGVITSRLINLPEVESLGLELETRWTPIDRLTVSLNYTYLKTEIVEAPRVVDAHDPNAIRPGARPSGAPDVIRLLGIPIGTSQPQTVVGNQLPSSPEHKLALNASYEMDFFGGDLILSGTVNWRDDSYYTIFNQPDFLTEGGSTTDLTAVWRGPEDRWVLIGSVTNVFDEDLSNGYNTLPPTQNFFHILYLEPPRVASLEIQYHF